MEGKNPFAGLQDIEARIVTTGVEELSKEYANRTPASENTGRKTRTNKTRETKEFETPKTTGKRKKTQTAEISKRRTRQSPGMADLSQEMDVGTVGGAAEDGVESDPFKRMQAFMEKQFAQTNENITKVNSTLGKLNDRVNVDSRNLNRMKETVETNAKTTKAELQNMNTLIEERNRERKEEIEQLRREIGNDGAKVQGVSPAFHDGQGWKEREYWLARRKARIWPIQGKGRSELWKNVGNFLFQDMRVPASNVSEANVTEIVRVPTNSSERRKHVQEIDEVIVTFASSSIRDMVCSYARNLSDHKNEEGMPTAGVRKELPEYLIGVNRALLHHGSILRRTHGKKLRRNIKFDDAEMSLYMDVCLPGETTWLKVDYEMALSERRSDHKRDSDKIRHRLTSTQSESSDTGTLSPAHNNGPLRPPLLDLTDEPVRNTPVATWGSDK